ncbi:MAG: sigma-54 dependent transcriptional regulator [Pseudomonadota bacterium]
MSASHILVVDDESDIRSLIQEILSEEGYDVTVAADAREARSARDSRDPDLVLLDIWMPDTDGISLLREWTQSADYVCPVVMMSGHGTVDTAVEATRLGAFDYIEKPLSLAKLLRTVERALESGGTAARGGSPGLASAVAVPVGRSPIIRELREQAKSLAPHVTPVLFVGEPGSGREAFARYVHDLGPRGGGEFVQLTPAALSGSSAAAALFGGQRDGEKGLLTRAGDGSVFIGELGDLSQDVQTLLLGVMEQQTYSPVGSGESFPLTARLMASVRPDYETALDSGQIRRDLFARLNVLSLRVPPLRDYPEDVPELLRFYVDRLVDAEKLGFRRFGVAAQNRLRNYPWPDNVRELKNLVHRLLITGKDEEVSLAEIEANLSAPDSGADMLVQKDLLALPLREAREHFERAYLTQQLELCDGKVGQLAKRVGMERTHLYRKLRSLGIDFRQTSGAGDD